MRYGLELQKTGLFFHLMGLRGSSALRERWRPVDLRLALWSKVSCVGAGVSWMGENGSTGKKWKTPGRKEKEG
jgi:hypothetical protein